MIFLGLVLAQRNFSVLSDQAVELQREVALRIANEVSAFILERENELRLLNRVQNIQVLGEDLQLRILSGLLATQNTYDELSLVDANGKEKLSVNRLGTRLNTQRDYANSPEFENPQASGETYFSPVQFDDETGEPFMTISLPTYDLRSGAFSGILRADIRFKPVWDLMSNADTPGSGIVYVVNDHNEIVAHRDPTVVLGTTLFAVPEINGFYPGLESDNAAIAVVADYFGDEVLYTVAELPGDEAIALAGENLFLTVGILVATLGVAIFLSFLAVRQIVRPIEGMAATAQAVSDGDLSQRVIVTSRDEIGTLGASFNSMTDQLQELISSLEQRVESRTRALEASTEIGRRLATILNLHQLVSEVVNLIKTTFDYYHAHIYLLDEATRTLDMAGGTGEVGQRMLASGHKLRLDQGLVGRAATTKTPVLIPDVTQDPTWLPNPLLPDTLAETAVPIIYQNTVLGVLDVQHNITHGLSDEDVRLLQAIASQVAIAVRNARLYEQAQQQAEQQTTINEISQRIRKATDVESVLQIAAHELGLALGARRASVELSRPTVTDNGRTKERA
ncbi:MAG: GAF domain-containing protein [Ardenticatenaceae bacterium]|nr:GAF domain-containing protein [Ardenticatenaceae bacterium]